MQKLAEIQKDLSFAFTARNIDKTISIVDLALWSRVRFSVFLLYGNGMPFIPDA